MSKLRLVPVSVVVLLVAASAFDRESESLHRADAFRDKRGASR